MEFDLEEAALFLCLRDLIKFHPRVATLATFADRFAKGEIPSSLQTRSMTTGDGRMCCNAALEATNWELHKAPTPIFNSGKIRREVPSQLQRTSVRELLPLRLRCPQSHASASGCTTSTKPPVKAPTSSHVRSAFTGKLRRHRAGRAAATTK